MSIKNLSILLALTVPLMAMNRSGQEYPNDQTNAPAIMGLGKTKPNKTYQFQEIDKINELNNKQLSTGDANNELIKATMKNYDKLAMVLMDKKEGSTPDQEGITKAFNQLNLSSKVEFFYLFLDQPDEKKPDQTVINNFYKDVYRNLVEAKEKNQANEKNVTQFTIDQITSKLKILEQHVSKELKQSLEK